MEEKKIESQTFVSVLTITNVVSNDYGSYLCVAQSEMGNVTEKAILSGKRKKNIKRIIQLNQSKSISNLFLN